MRLLKWQINSDERDYFIEKVNKPLVKAITILANRYPEPTRENLLHPNSLRLLDIRDKYLQYDTNERRRELFKAGFRILIAKYEHSPNWRYPIEFILEEIFKSGWKPRPYGHPVTFWNEPKPYGGKEVIK